MKKILALILALILIFALTAPGAMATAEGPAPAVPDTILQSFRDQAIKAIKELITTAVIALFGWLGIQIKNLYNKFITTKIAKDVCRTTVRYVEQVYKDLHGREKLRKAMERAADILVSKGIFISENELESLLEAAVNEFNDNFSKTDPETKANDKFEKAFGALGRTEAVK